MNSALRLIFMLLIGISLHAQATPRTVFVQLFEWPWKDVAKECEVYLGPAGFAAVQVSPPHEHIMWQNHPWWERYQVVSYNLNSRSGNEDDFKDMVRRCKDAGVDVYADAVLNHTTGIPGGKGYSGTPFGHYQYPGLFSYEDFHHCGRNGNDNIYHFGDLYELQNCELLDLADLDTSSEYVQNKQADYLNHLLDLGVAGFRIDAAKHIPANDLVAIKKKLTSPAYIYSEVIYDPHGPISYSDYLPIGDVMAYDYSHKLARVFFEKNTDLIRHLSEGLPTTSDAVVFLTNHDLERNPYSGSINIGNGNQVLYRLAQIFMLAWPYGYPQLYSGYQFYDSEAGPPLNTDGSTAPVLDSQYNCQGIWTCEHRLLEIAPMVDFRNQTDKAFKIDQWWSNGHDVLAFSRGTLGFIALNFSSNEITRDFSTSMPDGVYCNILDPNYNLQEHSCERGVQVDNGKIRINMFAMSAMVLMRKTTVKKP